MTSPGPVGYVSGGIAGAAGLVHHFVCGFTLFALISRIPLLARYDLYVSIALIVLGLALLIADDRAQPPHRDQAEPEVTDLG